MQCTAALADLPRSRRRGGDSFSSSPSRAINRDQASCGSILHRRRCSGRSSFLLVLCGDGRHHILYNGSKVTGNRGIASEHQGAKYPSFRIETHPTDIKPHCVRHRCCLTFSTTIRKWILCFKVIGLYSMQAVRSRAWQQSTCWTYNCRRFQHDITPCVSWP